VQSVLGYNGLMTYFSRVMDRFRGYFQSKKKKKQTKENAVDLEVQHETFLSNIADINEGRVDVSHYIKEAGDTSDFPGDLKSFDKGLGISSKDVQYIVSQKNNRLKQ
jgi:hypothetical protein